MLGRVVHCKKDPYDIYIGRPKDDLKFHWGNPFSHADVSKAKVRLATRTDAVNAFRDWLNGTAYQEIEPERRQWMLDHIRDLNGKVIACWCSPQACHGDVLLEFVERQEALDFDWDPSKLKPPIKQTIPKIPLSVMDIEKDESREDRILRMLRPLSDVVRACSMCNLGKKACIDKSSVFDPHVFSNMIPSRIMVVGNNPGFNEVLQGEPFVGDAGKYFNDCLKKNGLQRSDFYITNTVKCHTVGNEKPTFEQMVACEPILRMELQLLKPLFVITLGAVAFNVFCFDLQFGECRGEFVESKKFGVKVYPIFHPSGRNMSVPEHKVEFESDIADICKLIVEYKNRNIT